MQSETIGELVAAIGAIMADVGYVRGTGRNTHHKYNYTSDEDLAAAIQPALVKHGVAIFPVASDIERSGDRTIIMQTFRVGHKSGEWMQLQIPGEGVDKQDKGTAKALTGARKYLMRLLFCVPTGDDNEKEDAVTAKVTQHVASTSDFTPFVSDLLDRIEVLQQKGVANSGAAAKKLIKMASSGLTDDEIRKSGEKLIDWVNAGGKAS